VLGEVARGGEVEVEVAWREERGGVGTRWGAAAAAGLEREDESGTNEVLGATLSLAYPPPRKNNNNNSFSPFITSVPHNNRH